MKKWLSKVAGGFRSSTQAKGNAQPAVCPARKASEKDYSSKPLRKMTTADMPIEIRELQTIVEAMESTLKDAELHDIPMGKTKTAFEEKKLHLAQMKQDFETNGGEIKLPEDTSDGESKTSVKKQETKFASEPKKTVISVLKPAVKEQDASGPKKFISAPKVVCIKADSSDGKIAVGATNESAAAKMPSDGAEQSNLVRVGIENFAQYHRLFSAAEERKDTKAMESAIEQFARNIDSVEKLVASSNEELIKARRTMQEMQSSLAIIAPQPPAWGEQSSLVRPLDSAANIVVSPRNRPKLPEGVPESPRARKSAAVIRSKKLAKSCRSTTRTVTAIGRQRNHTATGFAGPDVNAIPKQPPSPAGDRTPKRVTVKGQRAKRAQTLALDKP